MLARKEASRVGKLLNEHSVGRQYPEHSRIPSLFWRRASMLEETSSHFPTLLFRKTPELDPEPRGFNFPTSRLQIAPSR